MSHPASASGRPIRDPNELPADLSVPEDDGAGRHLPGCELPDLALPSTAGVVRDLRADSFRRWVVVYAYPRTGRPGEEAPGGQQAWDRTPGARGCTPQSNGYCQLMDRFERGRVAVYGLSTQSTGYQREAALRLNLRQELLSDAELRLTRALDLPTFTVAGQLLLRRHTLFLHQGRIQHVRYPVFPPDGDAEYALEWLHRHAGPAAPAG
jgi:peroxiredoxin